MAAGVCCLLSPCTRAASSHVPPPSGSRLTPLHVPNHGATGFVRLTPEDTGVHFTNRVPDAWLIRNQLYELGSGVALGDVDGDGWIDLYLCAIDGPNRLYRNLGDGTFLDVTDPARVACVGQASTGAVLADIDGDGDLDLIVNSLGDGTRVFLNDGRGRFTEVTEDSGLAGAHGSTSLALADIDGDGHLDLYVARYHTRTVKDAPHLLNEVRAGTVNGRFVVTPADRFQPLFLKSGGVSLFERGEADTLYLNDGTGRFIPVSWTDGTFLDEGGGPLIEPPLDWGLAVAFRDLNGDRAPDLYVCNDFFHSPDRVWINDGRGRFRAIPGLALRNQSLSSMAVDFADINRDGHDDIFVLDMLATTHRDRHRHRASRIHLQVGRPFTQPDYRPEYPRNTLALARGDGTYAEIAQYAGLDASGWSWGAAFVDVDLDGYEDILVTTGNLRDANDADSGRDRSGPLDAARRRSRPPLPSKLELPCLAFRNHGDLTFTEVGADWGFSTLGISHGIALADLDNDGDLDVVVNHVHQSVGIYRNTGVAPRVQVRLHGRAPNTRAVGARLRVTGGPGGGQSQEIIAGGRYLSGDDPARTFAAGVATNRLQVHVTWRSGAVSLVRDVPANHRLEIWEPDSPSTPRSSPPAAPPPDPIPWFEDLSGRLRQPHAEPPFDESPLQPLLERSLASRGPGVGWYDVDGDGWEDLFMASGRGGYPVLHLNDTRGSFRPLRRAEPAPLDQTTVLGWRSPDGQPRMLFGYAHYEGWGPSEPAVIEFPLRSSDPPHTLPANPSSVGPLALSIVDGTPVLFVGGQVRPGRYPEAASSRLLTWRSGAWHPDTQATAAFDAVGLVQGATWADLDGDGRPELILACDWSPLRTFALEKGVWIETTARLGLARYRGWWNGVAAGDFDGDGRLDLVATNWGRNTRHQRHRARPLRLYYGDWNGSGRIDLLEAYHDPDLARYVPFQTWDVLREAVPPLAARFAGHAAYAEAGIDDILADHPSTTRWIEADWFETTVFLNRPGGFEALPLPAEAQFAPAFGVAVSDFDGDGFEDLVLAQNFFAVPADTSRHDAGRGLLLLGDGHGGFRAIPGQVSGLRLYGEQRGAAASDFDQDGRVDLVIAQWNGPPGLFRNRSATPGLRVRLNGGTANPDGLGATIRLQYGTRFGPARTVAAGSGYWSQNGAVQVMGLAGVPSHLQVRWPDGTLTVRPVPAGAREISVHAAESPGVTQGSDSNR